MSCIQVTVQEIMKHGGLASLPEEVQWQVRLLLPRQADQVPVNVREGSVPEDATPRNAELPANMEVEETAQQAGNVLCPYIDSKSLPIRGSFSCIKIGAPRPGEHAW